MYITFPFMTLHLMHGVEVHVILYTLSFLSYQQLLMRIPKREHAPWCEMAKNLVTVLILITVYAAN